MHLNHPARRAVHRSGDRVIRPPSRRKFTNRVAALAAGFAVGLMPHPAPAQQTTRRIGVLLVTFSPESKEVQAFRQGLREAGYLEEHDLVIEWRSAKGVFWRQPNMHTN
jgi:hypothetical protein